jgi:hypothetical protein
MTPRALSNGHARKRNTFRWRDEHAAMYNHNQSTRLVVSSSHLSLPIKNYKNKSVTKVAKREGKGRTIDVCYKFYVFFLPTPAKHGHSIYFFSGALKT